MGRAAATRKAILSAARPLLYCLPFVSLCAGHSKADDRPKLTAQPRYQEDYSFLADPAWRTDLFDPIKYILLDNVPNTYVFFGGELRERYEDFTHNPLFGLQDLGRDDYLLSRTLVHADLHLGAYFRSFVQLGYQDVFGKDGAVTNTERSGLDLQQVFAEADAPVENSNLALRVGRQEMALGSQRLVGLREGPNIRQSFDMVRAIYDGGPYNVTAFLGRPVKIGPKNFDDVSDPAQGFSGVYAILPLARNAFADFYYLDLRRDGAKFAQGTADERRHNVGARLWDAKSALDYNFEFVYQWGRFGTGRIAAWTVASDTGYTLAERPWAPRLALKADIASGDRDPKDPDLNTFNALFPRGSYFTENGLVGPANFIDLQPNVTLSPAKDISVNFGADVLWRESTQDAVYRQPNIPIPGTAGNPHRFTGIQEFVLGTLQIDPHASLSATYVHFAVGDAIKQAGGGNSDYVGTWVAYRF